VAEWKRGDDNLMTWRIPNSVYPKVKGIKTVRVKKYERVAFVTKGDILVVRSGEHHIPAQTQEIIWVDVSPKMLRYGIAKCRHLLTKDNQSIGFSGTVTLKVGETESDVKKFLTKFVRHRFSLNEDELKNWLRDSLLISAFRGFLGKITHEDFLKVGREKIVYNLIPTLAEELSKYGLELLSLDITGITY
jgi:uncharacterized membrane protein YqiK